MKYKLVLAALFIFLFSISAFSQDEVISFTTYYPSPYGIYKELRSQHVAIGDTFINNSAISWDTPVLTGAIDASKLSLAVEGNVILAGGDPGPWGSSAITPRSWIGRCFDISCKSGIPDGENGRYLHISGIANPNFGVVEGNPLKTARIIGLNDYVLLREGGKVGIGITTPAGLGSYDLAIKGDAYAHKWDTTSDLRLKENISSIKKPLEKVIRLRGVEFNWTEGDKSRQIGMIAQEVEKEFPELVTTNTDGFKALSYDRMSAVLVEALKEQQQQIQALQKEVEDLKKSR